MTNQEVIQELDYLLAETLCLAAYQPKAGKELRKFVDCNASEAKAIMDDWGRNYTNGMDNTRENRKQYIEEITKKHSLKEISGYVEANY